MEELFCHKVHCVNRSLFYLPVRVGSALTCYSLLLLSVLLGANMALSHFCVVFPGKKLYQLFYSYFPWQKLVFYLFLAAIGYRWTSSSLEVDNSLIYFAHLLKKIEGKYQHFQHQQVMEVFALLHSHVTANPDR